MLGRHRIRLILILLPLSVSAWLLYYSVRINSNLVIPQEIERELEMLRHSYEQSAIDHRQLLATDLTRTVHEQLQDDVDETVVDTSSLPPVLPSPEGHGLMITHSQESNTVRINIPMPLPDVALDTSDLKVISHYAFPLLSGDGFVRNCITNEIIGQIPKDLKTVLLKSPNGISPETAEDRKKSFQKVFNTRAWGHSWDMQYKGLNASGMGATLHWTQEVMAGLHVIINQLKFAYNVSQIRMLDVPCGDMAWMSRFLKTRDDIDYTGVDIVPELIRHHQETFKSYPWKFQSRDLVASPLNETYHLVLCRTLLQHLYNYDVMKLLNHISISGSGFLLSTSFFRHKENQDLVVDSENPGRFRRLNLELRPIALAPPQCMFRDGPPDAYEGWDHFLALWRLPLRKIRRCKVPTEFGLWPVNVKIFSCTNWSLTDSSKRL